jgi:hypothetical protein
VFGRDIGIGCARRRATWAGGEEIRIAQAGDSVAADLLAKNFDRSPRVIGWKYAIAISTMASKSDSAGAALRVDACDALIGTAKRERVRCCQPPATATIS